MMILDNEYKEQLDFIKKKIDNLSYPINTKNYYYLQCLLLALEASYQGTFGVGAILVDDLTGEIISKGKNQVLSSEKQIFSDKHAEMDCIDSFEETNYNIQYGQNKTLYTNLEPCIMCTARIITARIQNICYLSEDNFGACGIAKEILQGKYPAWTSIMKSNNIVFTQEPKDNIDSNLYILSKELFDITIPYSDKKLKNIVKSNKKMKKAQI